MTQIVRANEADVFHNRLTHSLKVAQVGRRLTEHCVSRDQDAAREYGVDPDVVEAACLAHDLGHPPFGHMGEKTLDELLTSGPTSAAEPVEKEGFEGNAQSFRIVTKLAVRFPICDGLDLTRATLAALQKYPWPRNIEVPKQRKKWGYYESEKDDFDFCKELIGEDTRSVEADIMDWADDIAYSIHDLEDFHRCNVIPWQKIFSEDPGEIEEIIQNAIISWYDPPVDAKGRLRAAHRRLSRFLSGFQNTFLNGFYVGTRDQRQAIRAITGSLVARYIRATNLVPLPEYEHDKSRLKLEEYAQDEVKLLKQIARDYIIASPSLAAQQRGQRRILVLLFEDFLDEINSGKLKLLPKRFHYLVEDGEVTPARIAADCVASLTEGEAIGLYHRLTGSTSGSVLDPIVR